MVLDARSLIESRLRLAAQHGRSALYLDDGAGEALCCSQGIARLQRARPLRTS